MNAEELRILQSPLKEKYRDDPSSAMITLSAEGESGENISFIVQGKDRKIIAGLHPATGGNGTLYCSADMLLESLVACTGVTMQAVAAAISFSFTKVQIKAEGDLDFRGTLGVSKEAPVGFKKIRLKLLFDTEEPDHKIESLLRLTERYCVVFQTLTQGVEIDVDFINQK